MTENNSTDSNLLHINENNNNKNVTKIVNKNEEYSLLTLLRAVFKDSNYVGVENGIQAYVLPKTDSHQNEYLLEKDERVKFISGFTGSNAFAVITEEHALLWTDSRYYVQASKELKNGWTLMKSSPNSLKPIDWIVKNMASGSSIGFDPNLFGYVEGKSFIEKLEFFQLKAISITEYNLIDLIWENRPAEQLKKIICHNIDECGENSTSKIKRLQTKMIKFKCDALVVTLLDDIAWLLNVRGFDIPFNSVFFSYVFVTLSEVYLFINTNKLSPEVQKHLSHVNILPYDNIKKFLSEYHKNFSSQIIWLPESTAYVLGLQLNFKYLYISSSPISLMKSVKNDIELLNIRNTNIYDSGAIVQFLFWINSEIETNHEVDEKKAAEQLYYFRSQIPNFVSLSFETISAIGKNAALPHYHLTDESNQKIESNKNFNSYYLFDSGGHYRSGTTDVTRTIYLDTKDAEYYFKKMFTLVFKCHVNLATLYFPHNINASRLDSIARTELWNNGFDFEHGVGHGVGCYLNVHENPPHIGFRSYNSNGGLKKGMIVTIEPGYYEKEKFGIRFENCYEIISVNSKKVPSGAENFLTFSPLTFVPIQKNLLLKELLEQKHIEWLNQYHNQCLELVGKYLQKQCLQKEYNFLAKACTPL